MVVDRACDRRKYFSREWNEGTGHIVRVTDVRCFVYREGREDGAVSFLTTGLREERRGVTVTEASLTGTIAGDLLGTVTIGVSFECHVPSNCSLLRTDLRAILLCTHDEDGERLVKKVEQ